MYNLGSQTPASTYEWRNPGRYELASSRKGLELTKHDHDSLSDHANQLCCCLQTLMANADLAHLDDSESEEEISEDELPVNRDMEVGLIRPF